MIKNNLLLMAMMFLTFIGFSQVNTQNETGDTACDGIAIIANPSNYTTWTWYDTDGSTVLGTDVDTITGLCDGVYTISLTDTSTWLLDFTIGTDGDCSGFSVSAQTVNTSDDVTCDGSASATITGGTAPYSYWWSNGNTSTQIDLLCVGSYNIIVQDANNCMDTVYVQIESDSSVNDPCAGFDAYVQTTNNTLVSGCDGSAQIYLSGADGSEQYFWSQGTYTDQANDLCTGSYTVTIMNSTGTCEDIVTFYIGDDSFQDSLDNIWINVNVADEDGSCDGSASASVYGGTAPYTYEWSTGETTMLIDGLCEGMYSVIVTDAGGNSSSTSFYVSDVEDVIDPTNYPDSTGVDTLFSAVNIDCDIDYSDIQSTFINDFVQTGDTIQITWLVLMNNGDTVEITTDFNFSQNNQGVYTFVLSVFCPDKAMANNLKAYDNIFVGTTGIEEELSLEFGVYPNPANDMISISGDFTNAKLQIIDTRGRTVQSLNNVNPGQTLNVSSLDKGIYFIQTQVGVQTGIVKMIKK